MLVLRGTADVGSNSPKKFYIQDMSTKGERIRTIRVHILSRTIACAFWYDYLFLWFNKECIDQSNPHDQELDIQPTDIVYNHNLYPLGLLQSYFNYQWQIDMFTLLVEGDDITTD